VDKQQVIEKIASDVFPSGPVVPLSTVAVFGDVVALLDPTSTSEPDAVYEFSQQGGACSLVEVAKRTAEQWLSQEGYSSTRLVTLLDLEARLATAQKTSPKLAASRVWVNEILAAFMADSTPRYVWAKAPYPFAEVTAEALAALA
jgi:hypothetical protein